MFRPAAVLCLSSALLVAISTPRSASGGVESPIGRVSSDALVSWLDRRFAEHWQSQGIKSPDVVDDATFLRRAYLDLVGTIPTVSEVRDFLVDSSSKKRAMLIDRLLEHPRHPEHLARVWRRVLVPGNGPQAVMGRQLDQWLAEQFRRDLPYDVMTRQLVTAGGADARAAEAIEQEAGLEESASTVTPVAYLQAAGGQPENMTSSVSRVFLGVRLECAQCHDHPFSEWKQEDFWGLAAFFAGSRLNPQVGQPGDALEALVDQRVTEITPPDSGTTYQARYLWTADQTAAIPEDKLPRRAFSEWLTRPENPHFAATAVNRVWQYLCGQGLTDSVDDLDQATDAQRAIVLDDLATQFAREGFDIKWLVRGICKSRFYSRPSTDHERSVDTLAERPLKVLTPEQLFDALEVALALPISRLDQGPRYNGQRDQIVARMSEALGERPDEFRSGIPQALMLMNGRLTAEATDLETSRTLRAVVDAPFLKSYEKIETLFLATLTRRPHNSEMQRFMAYVDAQPTAEKKSAAYSEIMWALINSPEFVLCQ